MAEKDMHASYSILGHAKCDNKLADGFLHLCFPLILTKDAPLHFWPKSSHIIPPEAQDCLITSFFPFCIDYISS